MMNGYLKDSKNVKNTGEGVHFQQLTTEVTDLKNLPNNEPFHMYYCKDIREQTFRGLP